MSRMSLHFKLPEELNEATYAWEGSSLRSVIFEFDQYLSRAKKYGYLDELSLSQLEIGAVLLIRNKLYHLLNEARIEL